MPAVISPKRTVSRPTRRSSRRRESTATLVLSSSAAAAASALTSSSSCSSPPPPSSSSYPAHSTPEPSVVVTPSSKEKTTIPSRKRKASAGRDGMSQMLQLEPETVIASSSSVAPSTAPIPSATNTKMPLLTSDMIAAINPTQDFIDLEVPPEELRPSVSLTTGQCFHWKVVEVVDDLQQEEDGTDNSNGSNTNNCNNGSNSNGRNKDNSSPTSAWGPHDAKEWVGTLRLPPPHSDQSVVVAVRQTPTTTLYRPLTRIDIDSATDTNQILHDFLRHGYFQIDPTKNITLKNLYQEWSQACPRMKAISQCLPGVRVLQQDPWECLVSFICSSNNNIPRITQMLEKLRREYGRPLMTVEADSEANGDEALTFYSFPSLQDMLSSGVTEKDLREKCGMGYRAKFIVGTMQLLQEKGGEVYLHKYLDMLFDEEHENGALCLQERLCEFPGVGRKVADCVALFSLRGDSCIPVDTHVWNIVRRDYFSRDSDDGTSAILSASTKSLTPSVYQAVGDLFRERFPNKAGWAHSLLFVAELPSFRDVLPRSLVQEMDEFRREEQTRKKDLKDQQKQKRKLPN